MRDSLLLWALFAIAPYPLVALVIWLAITGYADVLAGLVALAMVVSRIWLSAKGMARLKEHETGAISGTCVGNSLPLSQRRHRARFDWLRFAGVFVGDFPGTFHWRRIPGYVARIST